jgi:hypothetical protein
LIEKASLRVALATITFPFLLAVANPAHAQAAAERDPFAVAQFERGGDDVREERRRDREQLREERRERRREERDEERERRREERRLDRDELRDLPREERRRRRDELREERRGERPGTQREPSQDRQRYEDLGLPDDRQSDRLQEQEGRF